MDLLGRPQQCQCHRWNVQAQSNRALKLKLDHPKCLILILMWIRPFSLLIQGLISHLELQSNQRYLTAPHSNACQSTTPSIHAARCMVLQYIQICKEAECNHSEFQVQLTWKELVLERQMIWHSFGLGYPKLRLRMTFWITRVTEIESKQSLEQQDLKVLKEDHVPMVEVKELDQVRTCMVVVLKYATGWRLQHKTGQWISNTTLLELQCVKFCVLKKKPKNSRNPVQKVHQDEITSLDLPNQLELPTDCQIHQDRTLLIY